MSPSEFYQFAAILGMAAVAGLIANKLRQPVIVAFVAIGIAVGPVGTGWVVANDKVELLSRLGIAMLLFLVGLKLDVHLIRSTGPVALATGLGQVFVTSVVGFLLSIALGLDRTAAIYVAVALTFSSTIIIVKLLSDKRELDELHGRIAVGFLIVQDVVVIMVMITLTALSKGTADGFGAQAFLVFGKGLGLLAGIAVVARYLLPTFLRLAARSAELLVLFAVAWAVGVASISDWLGFSTEIGAFLAGVALASTPYREAAGARLTSLRDFLLLFFFLDLGARLEFTDAGDQVLPAAVLSLFVLIGNPLIVVIIMGAMRYPVRVSFLAGLTVAQISEFSLILAALGLSLGHIDNSTVGLITIIGLVTISLSTYLILYSHAIYDRLAPVLSVFERRTPRRLPDDGSLARHADVIIYGLGRYGSEIVDRLRACDIDPAVLAVDFDPHATAQWNAAGINALYGDAEDLDLLESLPLETARWVISTIPAAEVSLALLHGLRHSRFRGRIALTAHNRHDVDRLRASGADVVLEPFSIAAQHIVDEVVHSLTHSREGPPMAD